MDELCPLCLKMGSNKRIKAVQINLDEAVWMCENEGCPWPIGHEWPNFISRKVGEKWSKEWEIYKKVQKRIGPIPISTELSLYTPPVTPSSDATSKDSTKSDYTCEANISERMRHVGNILGNSRPNDSYAPKSSSRGDDKGAADISTMHDGKSENAMMDSAMVDRTAPVLSSIFDIDCDELTSDKMMAKRYSDETTKIEVSPIVSEIADAKDSARLDDTVLKVSSKRENPSDQFFQRKKEKIAARSAKYDGPTRPIMPQIRSISTTNIDVQIMDYQETAKKKKIDLPRSEKTNCPRKMDIPSDDESIISRKQEILDDSGHLRLRTTTIKIDGSLPITLSYDPTALEGKKVETHHVATRNNSGDIVEMPVELSKKQFRPPAKRRIASIGKQYEKFSFSALKKFVRESKDCGDKSSNVIASRIIDQRVGSGEIEISRDDKPSLVTASVESSRLLANNKSSRASNRIDECENSKNIDHVDAANDDPVVESLSGVLDDILMEDYQNVTANLNDDWLESFFTSDT